MKTAHRLFVLALLVAVAAAAVENFYWVPYEIQSGDTLLELSGRCDVSVDEIVSNNDYCYWENYQDFCITNPDEIYAGQKIWLPYTCVYYKKDVKYQEVCFPSSQLDIMEIIPIVCFTIPQWYCSFLLC